MNGPRAIPAALTLLLGATTVQAAESVDARRACLASEVPLSDVAFVETEAGTHRIEVTVTNDLDWPINGIRIGWELGVGSATVLSDEIGSFIPDAIAPGDSRRFSFYAPSPPEGLGATQVAARTIDVADTDGHQFVNDVRVMGGGWTNLTSPLECTPS